MPVARARSPAAPAPDNNGKTSTERADTREELTNRDEIETASGPMPMSLIEPVDIRPAAIDEAMLDAKAASTTWGLRVLRVDSAAFNGAGVRVAIIDTGIMRGHPAFAHMPKDAIVEADFTDTPDGVFGEGVAFDSNGHGTHCAATICGDKVDGIRIGIAPNITKLFVAKTIGGSRGSAALLDALNWAATKADVISMSLGFDFVGYRKALVDARIHPDAATSMALTAFRDNIRVFDAWMAQLKTRRQQKIDPLVVAATGNQSDRPTFMVEKVSPSEVDSVIAVGAVDETLKIAPFSNAHPKFVAPGVNVVSAGIRQNLSVKSGTSMACPHIAGLAALYWQAARSSSGPPASSEIVAQMMGASARLFYEEFKSQKFADIGAGMPRAPGIRPNGT